MKTLKKMMDKHRDEFWASRSGTENKLCHGGV
uniref:Uncharacterized protein n=1 Tax=Anguilla anguilla TaxID=7936 RepID=A0A0E9SAY9_ANGAN